MSLARDTTKLLTTLGGFTAFVDTLWGAVAVIPFDWTLPHDAILGVSFFLGLPAYLLDYWMNAQVVIFLPAVILFRGVAEYNVGSHWTVGWQLRGNELLIVAAVLLQWSKLRNTRVRDRNPRARPR